jgi:hypothetical protein
MLIGSGMGVAVVISVPVGVRLGISVLVDVPVGGGTVGVCDGAGRGGAGRQPARRKIIKRVMEIDCFILFTNKCFQCDKTAKSPDLA